MNRFIVVIFTFIFHSSCTQTNRDIMFSSTELTLLNSMVISGDPPSDTTNKWESDSKVQTLGQKFFWDPRFSGAVLNSGKILDTGDCDNDGSNDDLIDTVVGEFTISSATTTDGSPTITVPAAECIPVGTRVSSGTGVTDDSLVIGSNATANTITLNNNATASDTVSNIKLRQKAQISCTTCHNPVAGWEDRTDADQQDNFTSFGVKTWTGRKALTVVNAYYNKQLWLWPGNADSAWGMISRPIEGDPHNFGRVAIAFTICRIYLSDYNIAFSGSTESDFETLAIGSGICSAVENHFIAKTCNLDGTSSQKPGNFNDACYAALSSTNQAKVNRIYANYMKAIAAFERQIVSKNSAFDKVMLDTDGSAMSNEAIRGAKVFIGKGNCVACHNGPALTDNSVHNLGVPQDNGYVYLIDKGYGSGFSDLTGGTSGQHSMFLSTGSYSDDTSAGTDRLASIPAAEDGAFKTPGLRDLTNRGPFMHTGSFKTLWDVLEFYNFGGGGSNFSGTKDSRMIPRNLTDTELQELVAFLRALEGEALSTSLTSKPTLP